MSAHVYERQPSTRSLKCEQCTVIWYKIRVFFAMDQWNCKNLHSCLGKLIELLSLFAILNQLPCLKLIFVLPYFVLNFSSGVMVTFLVTNTLLILKSPGGGCGTVHPFILWLFFLTFALFSLFFFISLFFTFLFLFIVCIYTRMLRKSGRFLSKLLVHGYSVCIQLGIFYRCKIEHVLWAISNLSILFKGL